MKCFRNAGITGSSFSVVSHVYETEDPFDEVEAQEESHHLVDQIQSNCLAEEYINIVRIMYLFVGIGSLLCCIVNLY